MLCVCAMLRLPPIVHVLACVVQCLSFNEISYSNGDAWRLKAGRSELSGHLVCNETRRPNTGEGGGGASVLSHPYLHRS